MTLKSFRIGVFLILFVCFFSQNVFSGDGEDSAELLGSGQIDMRFYAPEIYSPEVILPLVFQSDGKIVAAGRLSPDVINNSRIRKIYRYLPDGTPDPNFNPFYSVPNPQITFLKLHNGKILYVRYFLDSQVYSTFEIIRLNDDGSKDETFNYDPFWRGFLYDIEILPDGKILLAGDFRDREDEPNSAFLVRLNPDGSFDNFSNSLDVPIEEVAIQSDGSFVYSLYEQNGVYGDLRRLKPDGTIDESFPVLPDIRSFRVLDDDSILVANNNLDLIKLLPSGEIDPNFQAEVTGNVYGVALDPQGNIIVRDRILNPDGSFLRPRGGGGSWQFSPSGELFATGSFRVQGRKVGVVKVFYEYTQTNRKAFDFDGDGKADIAVYRPSNGVWYIYYSSTNTYNFAKFGIAEDKPVSADYDGDTIADIAVYRPSTGVWYILRSSDGQVSIVRFGLAEDIPTPGDFDGDGKDDISLYRPSTGVWYRLNSSDGSFYAQQYGGLAGDRPVAADYDGDAIADLAFWRTSTGIWNYFSTINNSSVEKPWNFFEGDFAIPADYDGDGITDIALWKSRNTGWYVSQSNMGSGIYAEFGARSDIPVPADYDGNGKDDYAVWRPTTGEWLIRQADGSTFAFAFGTAGDIPIPSTFVR